MPAYAIAHLKTFNVNEGLLEYLERIDATLAPFDGKFVAQGAIPEVVEGEWEGVISLLEFPDRARATSWYESPEYQEIVPLRQSSADANAIVFDGVEDGHQSAALAEMLRSAMG